MSLAGFALTLLVLGSAFFWLRRTLRRQRGAYIEAYTFPQAIRRKISAKHPQLDHTQVDHVMAGLRDYFQICNLAGRRMVSMPSQAVDDAWHEFILFTRLYQRFCQKALGRFLHHTPAEAMSSPTLAQQGIKRAWRLACSKEGIDPRHPDRLPRLFAIDAALGIAGGFVYALECSDRNSAVFGSGYCASHIGCASGCAGDSGSGDGIFDSDGGGGDGCGGGCGGD